MRQYSPSLFLSCVPRVPTFECLIFGTCTTLFLPQIVTGPFFLSPTPLNNFCRDFFIAQNHVGYKKKGGGLRREVRTKTCRGVFFCCFCFFHIHFVFEVAFCISCVISWFDHNITRIAIAPVICCSLIQPPKSKRHHA